MTQPWERDKRWSDRFLPELKRIIGSELISEPPVEEDAERNTDLMVLRMDAVRVACRVRTHDYFARYPDEFTIRSGRPSGVKTELTKIVEGWGDYLIYGFSDADEQRLLAWSLIDLKVFRLWIMRHMSDHGGDLPGASQKNHDGSSTFHAFRIVNGPSDLVVASERPLVKRVAGTKIVPVSKWPSGS